MISCAGLFDPPTPYSEDVELVSGVWSAVPSCYRTWEVTAQDVRISLHFDWKAWHSRSRDSWRRGIAHETIAAPSVSEIISAALENRPSPAAVDCRIPYSLCVDASKSKRGSNFVLDDGILRELALDLECRLRTELFAVLNIASPGSCCDHEEKRYPGVLLEAIHRSKDIGWPHIRALDLEVVSNWFMKVGLRGNASGVDIGGPKSVAALLNLCRLRSASEDVHLWTDIALASLHGLPPRSGKEDSATWQKVLHASEAMLGSPPYESKRLVRNHIRTFYIQRNELVHSDGRVGLNSENDERQPLTKAQALAIRLLLASLQEIICPSGWIESNSQ